MESGVHFSPSTRVRHSQAVQAAFPSSPVLIIYIRYLISNRDNLNLNGPLATFLIGCKEFGAMVQPPGLLPALKPWTAKRHGQDV